MSRDADLTGLPTLSKLAQLTDHPKFFRCHAPMEHLPVALRNCFPSCFITIFR